MNKHCLICNNRTGVPLRNATSLFGEHNTLQSGKKLSDVVGEILNKQIVEGKVHTNILCRKCYKSCSEYDATQLKMESIRSELLEQFMLSLPSYNLRYDNYEKAVGKAASSKRLVLPASKLQPVSPELLAKVGRMNPLVKSNVIVQKIQPPSTVNLKVTVGSSVLTQTVKTTTSKLEDPIVSLSTNLRKDIDSMLERQTIESVVMKTEKDADETMDIDDDSPLSMVTKNSGGKIVLQMEEVEDKNSSQSNTLESNTSANGDDQQKYILGNLEILDEGDGDDDDDEPHTIVLDGDNGSILQVMAGQKFIYEGGEISLVMPDEDSQNGDDKMPGSPDSNDESQIELQVSGDEETANAIIAAAQEQGGAFIKVESGGMYRVQSVRSSADIGRIVARVGSKFRCLLCARADSNNTETVFMGDATTMMNHLKKTHDARAYICSLCYEVMRKRSEFVAHMEAHAQKPPGPGSSSSSKQHGCGTCGKAFASRSLLAEHQHSHTGARPHVCLVCGKTFSSKYTHQAHLKTHSNRPRPFKCDKCGKTFFSQQNLNQHDKTHSGVRDFACSVCDKTFSTQHNLEVHGVVHSGKKEFVCSACGKAFARKAELRDHVRIHTGERPFACDMCDAQFSQRSNLHSHRRATHFDERRYPCEHCPKRFKRRRLLEYHVKSSHTGERPLVCEVCNASFVYPEHYKKHTRIHSGERPYVCEICGKSFNSRDNRNTHRFVHSDKKPYECVQCGVGYMRKQLLYAHMNSSGHLAESIVVNQPRVTTLLENGTIKPLDAQIKTVKQGENIEEVFNSETIENNSEGKATLNIVEEEAALLTIHNIGDQIDGSILGAVNADQLDEAEILANCEDGGTVRLIQIKLPDGNNGWVALNR